MPSSGCRSLEGGETSTCDHEGGGTQECDRERICRFENAQYIVKGIYLASREEFLRAKAAALSLRSHMPCRSVDKGSQPTV
jgi:hypothetical protein